MVTTLKQGLSWPILLSILLLLFFLTDITNIQVLAKSSSNSNQSNINKNKSVLNPNLQSNIIQETSLLGTVTQYPSSSNPTTQDPSSSDPITQDPSLFDNIFENIKHISTFYQKNHAPNMVYFTYLLDFKDPIYYSKPLQIQIEILDGILNQNYKKMPIFSNFLEKKMQREEIMPENLKKEEKEEYLFDINRVETKVKNNKKGEQGEQGEKNIFFSQNLQNLQKNFETSSIADPLTSLGSSLEPEEQSSIQPAIMVSFVPNYDIPEQQTEDATWTFDWSTESHIASPRHHLIPLTQISDQTTIKSEKITFSGGVNEIINNWSLSEKYNFHSRPQFLKISLPISDFIFFREEENDDDFLVEPRIILHISLILDDPDGTDSGDDGSGDGSGDGNDATGDGSGDGNDASGDGSSDDNGGSGSSSTLPSTVPSIITTSTPLKPLQTPPTPLQTPPTPQIIVSKSIELLYTNADTNTETTNTSTETTNTSTETTDTSTETTGTTGATQMTATQYPKQGTNYVTVHNSQFSPNISPYQSTISEYPTNLVSRIEQYYGYLYTLGNYVHRSESDKICHLIVKTEDCKWVTIDELDDDGFWTSREELQCEYNDIISNYVKVWIDNDLNQLKSIIFVEPTTSSVIPTNLYLGYYSLYFSCPNINVNQDVSMSFIDWRRDWKGVLGYRTNSLAYNQSNQEINPDGVDADDGSIDPDGGGDGSIDPDGGGDGSIDPNGGGDASIDPNDGTGGSNTNNNINTNAALSTQNNNRLKTRTLSTKNPSPTVKKPSTITTASKTKTTRFLKSTTATTPISPLEQLYFSQIPPSTPEQLSKGLNITEIEWRKFQKDGRSINFPSWSCVHSYSRPYPPLSDTDLGIETYSGIRCDRSIVGYPNDGDNEEKHGLGFSWIIFVCIVGFIVILIISCTLYHAGCCFCDNSEERKKKKDEKDAIELIKEQERKEKNDIILDTQKRDQLEIDIANKHSIEYNPSITIYARKDMPKNPYKAPGDKLKDRYNSPTETTQNTPYVYTPSADNPKDYSYKDQSPKTPIYNATYAIDTTPKGSNPRYGYSPMETTNSPYKP